MSDSQLEVKDILLLPNLWTSLQFITLPLMLYFAWFQELELFVILYLLTFFIDSTDGFLARYLGLCTKLGMYLDTYLDLTMYIIVAFSLYLFIPDFLANYLVVLIVLFSITLLSRLLSFIRFQRVLMLHLYTSKMLYFFLTLFIVHFFVTKNPSDILFLILLIDAAIFILEELLIVFFLKKPREDILSIVDIIRK